MLTSLTAPASTHAGYELEIFSAASLSQCCGTVGSDWPEVRDGLTAEVTIR